MEKIDYQDQVNVNVGFYYQSSEETGLHSLYMNLKYVNPVNKEERTTQWGIIGATEQSVFFPKAMAMMENPITIEDKIKSIIEDDTMKALDEITVLSKEEKENFFKLLKTPYQTTIVINLND